MPAHRRFRIARRIVLLAGPWLLLAGTFIAPESRAAELVSPAVEQQQNPGDAIVGTWKPNDMDVEIQIAGNGGQYAGTAVKAANPNLVNTVMLRGVAFDPASRTWRGEIFAPKRNGFVPMQIQMTAANGFKMVAGSGLMSKTIEWTRIQ